MSNNCTNNDSISSQDTCKENGCSNSPESTKPAVAVIGAGPAGLACAQTLLDLGYKVDIYEMSGSVGGMARSCEILGQTVDLGPHRFHTDEPLVKDFWADNLDSSETVHKERLSRILYKGKFFSYPLRGFEALFQLGLLESARCVLSYAKSTLFPRKEPTFEAWVSNAFGHRLYEIFFKTYSEKLWGIKCSELSDQFARERIRTLNLSKAVIRAFIPDRGKKERTLVSTFIYPAKGAGQMWNNTLARIMRSGGGTLTLNAYISEISCTDNQVKGIYVQKTTPVADHIATNAPHSQSADRTFIPYDYVVSSGNFSDLVSSIGALPDDIRGLTSDLKYRNTLLVYLKINPGSQDLPPDNWLYIHSPDVRSGRMCDMANWSAVMQKGQKEHVVCFEYWANNDDEIWNMPDDQLVEMARADAIATGIFTPESILDGAVHRVHRSYPVYTDGYASRLKEIIGHVDAINGLHFIGRNGSFKYNNMDHSVLMGILAAKKIAGQWNGRLWDINADSSTASQAAGKGPNDG